MTAAMATGFGDADGALVRGWLVTDGAETRLRDGDYVLGRDRLAEIRVHDLAVSRRHAKITVDGSAVVIEDLGSRNGTWVNEVKLEGPRTLADGDQVRMGGVRWLFRKNFEDIPTQAVLPPRVPGDHDEEVI